MTTSLSERPRAAGRGRASERPHDPVAEVARVLERHVGAIIAKSVVTSAARRCGCMPAALASAGLPEPLIDSIVRGLAVYVRDAGAREECRRLLQAFTRAKAPRETEFAVTVVSERDIVEARTRARELAQSIGFGHTDQIRISTVVSELARNIYAYAGTGFVSVRHKVAPKNGIWIRAADEGPGIGNLDEIMSGSYRSKTGMGLGLNACKRLMDLFHIVTAPGRGTIVTMEKFV